MSEKGQGDAAAEGTGVGSGGSGVVVDGKPAAGGGGSQADQSGPPATDTQTRVRSDVEVTPAEPLTDAELRDAIEKAMVPEADDFDLSKPEIPEMPEDLGKDEEPTVTGGGPTDTRSGWDKAPPEPKSSDDGLDGHGDEDDNDSDEEDDEDDEDDELFLDIPERLEQFDPRTLPSDPSKWTPQQRADWERFNEEHPTMIDDLDNRNVVS